MQKENHYWKGRNSFDIEKSVIQISHSWISIYIMRAKFLHSCVTDKEKA